MNKFVIVLIMGMLFVAGMAFFSPAKNNPFPSYVMVDKMTMASYEYVSENKELVAQFDCFCGCYEHSGHKSLLDCYYLNGKIESHASFCDVCKAIAQKVQKYTQEGKSIMESKELIKRDYL